MTVKNVLVATDFSEASQAAVVSARQLAHAFGGRLHVLHVVESVMAGAIGIEGYGPRLAELQRGIEEAARRQANAVISQEDRATLGAHAIVLTSSSPAQAIVSYAKDGDIDLVIVGTHGSSSTSHLLMGSVAERVVQMAACPVLVVRNPVQQSAATTARHVEAHT